MPSLRAFILVFVLPTAGSVALFAQADQSLPPTFELSYSNPGARSMGFGGSFVALADDATAAFANPAGLIQIGKTEISIEGRIWRHETPFIAGGRIFGDPVGIGLDTSPGLRSDESTQSISGLSFLSAVYPRQRVAFALYVHQLANYEFYGVTQGLFSGPWPTAGQRREFDLVKSLDLEIWSYGFATAYQVSEDLSLGLGLVYFEGTMTTRSDSYGRIASSVPPDVFFAPRQLIEENRFDSLLVTADDDDWGLTGGVLWHIGSGFSLGAFFRQAPKIRGRVELLTGPGFSSFAPGVPPDTSLGTDVISLPFPNAYGLGLSYRFPSERLTLSFEWDRIGYSSFLRGADDLLLEDGDELRLGGEYVFLSRRPIVALRFGLWLDPDHSFAYTGDNYVARALLPARGDVLHSAGGLGLAFRRFQVDLGIDLSERGDTLSLSTVYSF